MGTVTNVLFVSAENAVRSQLAEACLRHLGSEKFCAYSCGVPGRVAASVSPFTLDVLHRAGFPIALLVPKSWERFQGAGAPAMDFVISLDAVTADQHPLWPYQPEQAVWGYAPLLQGAQTGPGRRHRTEQTLFSLYRRIELLVNLRAKVTHRRQLRDDLREMAHL